MRLVSRGQPSRGIPYIAISSPRVEWTDPSLTGASIKRTPQHLSSPSKRRTTRPSGLLIIILWDTCLLLRVKTTRRDSGAVRDRRVGKNRIGGILGMRRARRQGNRNGLSGSRRMNRVSVVTAWLTSEPRLTKIARSLQTKLCLCLVWACQPRRSRRNLHQSRPLLEFQTFPCLVLLPMLRLLECRHPCHHYLEP